jgi:hypothetical protein
MARAHRNGSMVRVTIDADRSGFGGYQVAQDIQPEQALLLAGELAVAAMNERAIPVSELTRVLLHVRDLVTPGYNVPAQTYHDGVRNAADIIGQCFGINIQALASEELAK